MLAFRKPVQFNNSLIKAITVLSF